MHMSSLPGIFDDLAAWGNWFSMWRVGVRIGELNSTRFDALPVSLRSLFCSLWRDKRELLNFVFSAVSNCGRDGEERPS